MIMNTYFRQSKLTSFQRQLNLYGFIRITRGYDAGAYYHPFFLRGKPHIVKLMVRTRIKGTGLKPTSNPDQEPDFYSMNPVWGSADALSTAISDSFDDLSKPRNLDINYENSHSNASWSNLESLHLPETPSDEDLRIKETNHISQDDFLSQSHALDLGEMKTFKSLQNIQPNSFKNFTSTDSSLRQTFYPKLTRRNALSFSYMIEKPTPLTHACFREREEELYDPYRPIPISLDCQEHPINNAPDE